LTLETVTPSASAPPSQSSTGFRRSLGDTLAQLAAHLQRPGVVPVLIILLWACATLPNLTVRSFIYEEGTNAEIAKDVLAHGHFLQPIVYGIIWHDKPSLLSWLIAGTALVTGGVNEWSARLPVAKFERRMRNRRRDLMPGPLRSRAAAPGCPMS